MSSFAASFSSGEARALSFVPDDFRSPERRVERVRRAAERRLPESVAGSLIRLAERLPHSAARRASIDALSKPGSVAVVTGQQVGLFGGPLFSFLKAVSAVRIAETLEKESGVRCVPVFWLQTEDHDLDEIDHLDVLPADGALVRLRVESEHVARAPVSSVLLGEQVTAALAQLRSLLDGAPSANEVLALLERHYRPDARWSDAFAGVMAELLPELVLLDPRDEAIAVAANPVHQRACRESDAISTALLSGVAALHAAGFDPQVQIRPGAPLSFIHPDGADGPRHRPSRLDAGWLAQMKDPRCFSSSALLRPIVQDTVLPTAAVVLGPGELNYFAQLKPLYAHFGLELPLVVPRARARVIEPKVQTALKRLELSAADVEAPRETLMARLAPNEVDDVAAVERRLLDAIEPVLSSVNGVDDAVKRTRGTIAKAASRLAARVAHERRTREDTVAGRLERAQRSLFPGGVPQERVLGFVQFAASRGVGVFVKQVREAIVPFSTVIHELS